jgi:hypothetical protein
MLGLGVDIAFTNERYTTSCHALDRAWGRAQEVWVDQSRLAFERDHLAGVIAEARRYEGELRALTQTVETVRRRMA